MNRLQEMFDRQRAFQIDRNPNITNGTATQEEREQFTKEMVLHVMSEADEILDCVNWKAHVLTKRPVNREALIEECVDLYKFFLNILVAWDITVEEFSETFDRKSDLVEKRWLLEKEKTGR